MHPEAPPVLRFLVDEPVELGGVLAGDLVHDFRGEAGELLLDVFRGFGPDAVGVRVVRALHHRLDADIVDELGADRVERESRLALAAPIFAGLQFHPVAEAVLEFEIHAVQRIGEPAGAALAKRHFEARIVLEHARPIIPAMMWMSPI
jgi:hypothetical protein